MPYRLSISGHTAASRTARRAGLWRRGTCRPTAPTPSARFSKEAGVPSGHFFMVAGRADTQPLFPDDPISPPTAA